MKNENPLLARAVGIGAVLLAAFQCPAWTAFESQPGSARAVAIGPAYSALADDADAIFYNPAGLSQMRGPQLSATYSSLYSGLSDNSSLSDSGFAMAMPIEKNLGRVGVLGIGYNMLSLPGLYSESIIGLYYGRQIREALSLGVGLKYMGVKYGTDEYTAINPVFASSTGKSAPSLDIGALYSFNRQWDFSFSIKDTNSPDMGLKYSDPVSPSISLGARWRQKGVNVLGAVVRRSKDLTFNLGSEKWFFNDQIALRAGLDVGSRNYSKAVTGFGFGGERIRVDYAFAYPLSGISNTSGSHRVTFCYAFESTIIIDSAPVVAETAEVAVSKGPDEAALKKMLASIYARVKNGAFSQALELSVKLNTEAPAVQLYADLRARLQKVVDIMPDAVGKRKTEAVTRRGVEQFVVQDNPKWAVQLLTHAFSLERNNEKLNNFLRAIAKENSIPLDDLLSAMSYAQQKIYMALDEFKMQKYHECIKLCEDAILLDGDDVTAYKRLGSAYHMLKNEELARRNWEKAVKMAPNDEDTPKIRKLLQELEKKK